MAECMPDAAPLSPTTASRTEYDYRNSPLSEHERVFRLVQLLRHADGSVRYDLVSSPLANAPDYEAISYRWGSEERSHSIFVADATFGITSSVYDILNDSCLQPTETGETRHLWIDFLCINQRDKREKDHQIPLMRDIYAGASQVVVYLGDAADAQLAYHFITDLLEYTEAQQANRQALELLELLMPLVNPLRNLEGREAFFRMITHDYWSRTWIIQEIISGKRVFILYGGSYICWTSLESVVRSIGKERDLAYMFFYGLDKVRIVEVYGTLSCILNVSYIQRHVSSEPYLRLARILLLSGHHQSKYPEDKVIGLLGLSSDADHPDLQPNHKLTAAEVYIQATIHSLRQGCFFLLGIAGLAKRKRHHSKVPGLPSWVPDFSSSGFAVLDPPEGPYRSGGSFAATNVKNSDVTDTRKPNTLGLKGMIIGRIAAISTRCIDSSQWKQYDPCLHYQWPPPTDINSSGILECGTERALRKASYIHHEVWKLVEEHCSDPYLLPTGVPISRHEALWRTMVVNMGPGRDYPASEEMGMKYEKFQTSCKALRTVDLASGKEFHPPEIIDLKEFPHLTPGFPFVATDGGHMGLVLVGAEIGDLVCVLRGANVPYILRPVKDDDQGTMQLVCASYIHGFMDGEAIECGKYEERWIHII